MAAQILGKHPNWSTLEVARTIQRSVAAKRRNGSRLTYTVAYISKAITSVRGDLQHGADRDSEDDS